MFSFGDCPWCFSSATGQFFFFLKPDDGGHTHLVQPLLGNVFAFRLNVTPTTPFSKPKLSVGTFDLEYKHAVKIRSHSSTCIQLRNNFYKSKIITNQHKCQHCFIISKHKKIVNRINLASELGETLQWTGQKTPWCFFYFWVKTRFGFLVKICIRWANQVWG